MKQGIYSTNIYIGMMSLIITKMFHDRKYIFLVEIVVVVCFVYFVIEKSIYSSLMMRLVYFTALTLIVMANILREA
jgi:hypothetical protein